MISPTYSRGYIGNVDAFACWFSPLTRAFHYVDGCSTNRPGNPNVFTSSGDENEGSDIVTTVKRGGWRRRTTKQIEREGGTELGVERVGENT